MVVKEKVIKPELETVETGDALMDTFIHLKSLGRIIDRYLTSRIIKQDLTGVKHSIVYLVSQKFEGITPTILSKRMQRTKHTISRAITELEKDGIVKRTINPDDNRTTIITLTDKGEKYADKIITDMRKISHEAMACLSEEELQRLDEMLKRVRYHFLTEVLDQ